MRAEVQGAGDAGDRLIRVAAPAVTNPLNIQAVAKLGLRRRLAR